MEGSRVPSWSQNRSKIGSRRYLKQDTSLNRFWMALGSIFGRFWIQVGRQVGAKLAPTSEEKWVPKPCQKMIEKRGPRPMRQN